MLKFIIPACILLIGTMIALSVLKGNGLIRGITQGMLVSPARPAIAVAPAAGFELVEAGQTVLSLPVQGSSLRSTSVALTYALYRQTGTAPGQLRTLLGITDTDRTEWPVQPDSIVPPIRRHSINLDGQEAIAETFVLPEGKDPWGEGNTHLWHGGSLVRRCTFLLWFRRAKLLVEYHEPLPASPLPVADNLPLLAAFEQRSQAAFTLHSKGPLPRPDTRPAYPPQTVSRQALTNYLGELRDHTAR